MNVLYVHIFCYVYYCSNVKLCVHQNCKKKYFLLSDIQEKRKLWVFYTWIYFYSVSLRPFSAFLAELSKNKVCHYYICLNFFDVKQVFCPVVSFHLYFICVWWGWKISYEAISYVLVISEDWVLTTLLMEFSWPGGGSCLPFVWVHELILLTQAFYLLNYVKYLR